VQPPLTAFSGELVGVAAEADREQATGHERAAAPTLALGFALSRWRVAQVVGGPALI
jgi:hypothetical protein